MQPRGQPGGNRLSPKDIKDTMISKWAWVNKDGQESKRKAKASAIPKAYACVDPDQYRPMREPSRLPTFIQVDPQRGSMCAVHVLLNAMQGFLSDRLPTFTGELVHQGAQRAASTLSEPLSMKLHARNNFSIAALAAILQIPPRCFSRKLPNTVRCFGLSWASRS